MESTPPPGGPEGPPEPAPGPQSPSPGSPPPPPGQPPPYAPPQPPGYGGPVPPGGWTQPVAPTPPPLPGQLAGWGNRLAAWFIDGLIVGVPAVIVIVAFIGGIAATDNGGAGGFIAGLILSIVIFAVIGLLYAPLLMRRPGSNNGQTWGKQMLNIRVVRDNGQPFDFGYAALRELVVKQLLVGIASSIIPLIPWFLDYFWPLWDDQNRALHDMVVSTHVVET